MDKLMDKMQEAAMYITSRIGNTPVDIGMVLGSGLGGLADELQDAVAISYKDIPYFPVSTVFGHKGRLVVGTLEGKRVMCMQGRFHYYEGYGMDQVVFPIQVMHALGINNLLVTNAAGGVNSSYKPGDLMLITDHIKLIADSPMRGPNYDTLGERFFDMTNAYDKRLSALAREEAKRLGITLHEGVYMFFAGPSYETPAEVRAARILGSDAVGMSTVPEALAASHMRMKVLGISCITNMAAGILDQPLNHAEVMETSDRVKEAFTLLVRNVTKQWPV
ncbi:MAG: purine-nucleoside phosphorylase [Sphaerochaeta sp.]|jgi:purine-nucleoside phosphorylase|uniref:purine-nucleoside phosphorylase n=1 Tax=Sphaerochaeta sp. UBA5836 TaxID=1947474 RepID=UPI0025CFB265|nr:purine-nucleoside phosphorylase [Sphaerochaeta sp. UBA5836]MCK9598777.1 purine-nucleoside phosphorylase [Sphaerochaeta sp.]